MSRRVPSATDAQARRHMARTVSLASMAMPPPSKTPAARPASALAASGSVTTARGDAGPSRAGSPGRIKRHAGAGGVMPSKQSEGGIETRETNIQVVVRCRGRSSQEIEAASPVVATTEGPLGKSLTVESTTHASSSSISAFTASAACGTANNPSKTYSFDKVFGPEADQAMVFREVAEGMLDEVLAGYNCTIFAYGQTGTGKTHTMQGDIALTPLLRPSIEAGIIPRVLHRLFHLLESMPDAEYVVKCSYLELYNEELRDLLAPESRDPPVQGFGANPKDGAGLRIYEDNSKKGVVVQGLEETGILNLKDGLALLRKGSQKRQVAETKMNSESSRSHSIFTLTVHVKETSKASSEDMLRIGKFNLVDLAGSEAIGRSGAENKRAREAGMINQSLLTLGRVISALVDKGSHIPYRESKLTRLLQDSLGGRTKTCIVATVSPTRSNVEETLSTLDYAVRAKSILNKPEVNAHLTKAGLLKAYVADIERLKAELYATREKNGVYVPEDQWKEMQETHSQQKLNHDQAKQTAAAITIELATRKAEFDDLTTRFITTADELEAVRKAERHLSDLLKTIERELETARTALHDEQSVSAAYQQGEQRLDDVATSLKSIATASITDVGGLFEKLARRAKVLGSNADAATRFGADLGSIACSLRQGARDLGDAQNDQTQSIRAELDAIRQLTLEDSAREADRIDASSSSLDHLIRSLSKSVAKDQKEARDIGAGILSVKNEVVASVRVWAAGVSERNAMVVDELLRHQQDQLETVGVVLGSASDLVDAVISTAQSHVAAEAQAAAETRALADKAANDEVARLRAQNTQLVALLASERSKTRSLRTNLLSNLTSMIEDFTDAQDDSMQRAIAAINTANEHAAFEMESFQRHHESVMAETASKVARFTLELDEAGTTAGLQRETGRSTLDEVQNVMRSRLETYAAEVSSQATSQVQVIDGLCDRLDVVGQAASSTADSRARKQLATINSISEQAKDDFDAHRQHLQTYQQHAEHAVAGATDALDASNQAICRAHQIVIGHIDTLMDRSATYLQNDLVEEVVTGTTPRKRSWDALPVWERTEPRDVLLDILRKQRNADSAVINFSVPSAPPAANDMPIAFSAATLPSDSSSSTISTLSVNSVSSSRANVAIISVATPAPVNSRATKPKLAKKTSAPLEFERPVMTVLGEGGNVPRSIRR